MSFKFSFFFCNGDGFTRLLLLFVLFMNKTLRGDVWVCDYGVDRLFTKLRRVEGQLIFYSRSFGTQTDEVRDVHDPLDLVDDLKRLRINRVEILLPPLLLDVGTIFKIVGIIYNFLKYMG